MPPPLPKLISSDDTTNARRRRYELNRRYYNGDQPIGRNQQFRRRDAHRTPRNLMLLVIDTVAAHLGAAVVSYGTGEPFDTLDAYMRQVLDHNNAEELDYATELSCAVDGDAAQKITWDVTTKQVRIAHVDASTLFVETDPNDPYRASMAAQSYVVTVDQAGVLFPGRVPPGLLPGKSGTIQITEAWRPDTWSAWIGDNTEPLFTDPNPYGFIPYVIWPNVRVPGRTFWGRGDPEPLIDLQDRINRAAGDTDEVMELSGAIVILEGVQGSEDIAVRPGAIWELPPDSSAAMLEILGAGHIQQRLAHKDDVTHTFHQLARVPTTALGDTGRELSGAALQIELGPLIRLVARKRLSRSAALRRRAALIAQLGARFGGQPELPPEAAPPVVTWDEAIPSDRADELANAEAETRLGRSRAEVLRSIGVEDPDAELAARAQQDKSLTPGENDVRTTGSEPFPARRPAR